MALAPYPGRAQPPEQELAALRLTLDLRLSPQQFERVCQANRDAVLELAADGQPRQCQRLLSPQAAGFAPKDGMMARLWRLHVHLAAKSP